MKTKIQGVKGARDFYPEDMQARNWLYSKIRHVSELYGYQEYDGPFLEHLDLYAAKSGEELVKEQSYVFQDRGGEWITLRPELTPSLARMVAQQQGQLTFPLRWWSFGPMWRYERPQKGRTREFFQWNIDLVGIDTPEADAELVAVAADFLKTAGLSSDQVVLKINDRQLLEDELTKLGLEKSLHAGVFRLIDRIDKLSPEDWRNYGRDEIGLSIAQLDGITQMMRNERLWESSEKMIRFFDSISALGIRQFVEYDPQIVRGLQYYTGVVFEAWDRAGQFRAVLGGGRYDNLVEDVGGSPLSGVGFAMGDVVINLLLKHFGISLIDINSKNQPILVSVFDQPHMAASQQLAAELRTAGFRTSCYPEAAKLSKQFKYADKLGCPLVLIIGPDELVHETVSIKNLLHRDQVTIPRRDLPNYIYHLLALDPAS